MRAVMGCSWEPRSDLGWPRGCACAGAAPQGSCRTLQVLVGGARRGIPQQPQRKVPGSSMQAAALLCVLAGGAEVHHSEHCGEGCQAGRRQVLTLCARQLLRPRLPEVRGATVAKASQPDGRGRAGVSTTQAQDARKAGHGGRAPPGGRHSSSSPLQSAPAALPAWARGRPAAGGRPGTAPAGSLFLPQQCYHPAAPPVLRLCWQPWHTM